MSDLPPSSAPTGSAGSGAACPLRDARIPMKTHAFALAALLVPAALLLATLQAEAPEPSPELTAEAVVQIQVEALQANDEPYPDHGIETAFRFASPSNQVATGPLPRFAALVKGPVYGDMLGFARADYGEIAVDGDRAAQRVTLFHDDGRRVTYVFGLSRQDGGPYDGCWMTDSVVRRPPPENGFTRV